MATDPFPDSDAKGVQDDTRTGRAGAEGAQTDPAEATRAINGLRERKKLANRDALSMAALRLALERGLENVRVEDIAAAAGVSPRTFNNYFSSKYEAIVSRHIDRVRETVAFLRARPAAEPLWEAVVQAVLAPVGTADTSPDRRWTTGVGDLMREPALQGEIVRSSAGAAEAFAAAVAERTGTDAARDLYPNLVAAAVLAAQQAASDQWLRADPPVPLLPLLRSALEQLTAGLPDPSADH